MQAVVSGYSPKNDISPPQSAIYNPVAFLVFAFYRSWRTTLKV